MAEVLLEFARKRYKRRNNSVLSPKMLSGNGNGEFKLWFVPAKHGVGDSVREVAFLWLGRGNPLALSRRR